MARTEAYENIVRALEAYGTVLNESARTGDLPHAFERDREVESVLQRLEQPGNRSLLLLGPSGAGKTAVLHEVVHRLRAAGRTPTIVLQTSTGMMMSNTRYLGEWQTRVNAIVELARRPARVVLYITDIYDLLGAGTHDKSDESIGTFLRPYVEKGDIAVVGECTPDQFRRGLERHPAFKKLFQLLRVDEPPAAAARRVLAQCATQRAEESLLHDDLELEIPPAVLDRIQELARHHFPGQVFPGKAIQLLDQVLALHHETGARAAAREGQPRRVVLAPEDAVTALERSTGISGLLLDDARPLDLAAVQRFFEERVIGQPEALRAILEIITLIKAGVNDPHKPIGVFFFVGPTGVGKTELAKTLADFIFGSPDRLVRIDLSEFKDYSSFEKLIGNPQAGAANPLQHGTLTSRIREQPFSVILLDEFEKAHPNVFDLFLQVFDDGRLTDAIGHTTDFTQTIIIMTSNLGGEIAQDSPIGFKPETHLPAMEDVVKEMRKFFRPEFINRIDRVVLFGPLGRPEMRAIAQRELEKVLGRSGITRRNARVDVDPAVVDFLLKEGFSKEYGARPLKRQVERLVLLPVARQLISLTPGAGPALLRLQVMDGSVRVKRIAADETKVEPAAAEVTLVDPVHHRKVRLPAAAVLEEAQKFRARVARLAEVSGRDTLRAKKAELVKATGAPAFWDDPRRARATLAEIDRLERLLATLDGAEKRADDLASFAEAVRRKADPHAAARLADRYEDVRRHLERVEYVVRCRGPFDPCDAFVTIRLVAEAGDADDPVNLVAGMYRRWAEDRGLKVTVVDEESAREGAGTRLVALLLEGVSAFGILGGEAGLHEFIRGKTAGRARSVQHVAVEVLPRLEEEGAELRPQDLALEKRKTAGHGKLARAFRAHLVLRHKPTGTVVEGRSDRPADALQPLLEELLRARLFRTEKAVSGGDGAGAPDPDRIVRKYTLGPSPLVRDTHSKLATGALSDVLAGEIDAFLKARFADTAGD